MTNAEIYIKVKDIPVPKDGYTVFKDDNDCFFGKDNSNNIVFMLKSNDTKQTMLCQETKSLSFIYNKKCKFKLNGTEYDEIVHLLICKEKGFEEIDAFIRLTRAFTFNEFENNQFYFAKLFSSLSQLFQKNSNVTEKEIQGLFTELYIILYFYKKGINLAQHWQSKDRMKFDFTINVNKRLEIKSTLLDYHMHHFIHEQLMNDLYDIRIISVLLRKNDFGLNLYDVIKEIREIFKTDFALMLHIDSISFKCCKSQCELIRYDIPYLEKNIKFFRGKDIPRFKEKRPDGVYNTEYDCILENIDEISLTEMLTWIKNDEY